MNVGSMSRGQANEICNQIDNACKELGLDAQEVLSSAINEKLFFEVIIANLGIKTHFLISEIFNDPSVFDLSEIPSYVRLRYHKQALQKRKLDELNYFSSSKDMEFKELREVINNQGIISFEEFCLLIYNLSYDEELLNLSLQKDKEYLTMVCDPASNDKGVRAFTMVYSDNRWRVLPAKGCHFLKEGITYLYL